MCGAAALALAGLSAGLPGGDRGGSSLAYGGPFGGTAAPGMDGVRGLASPRLLTPVTLSSLIHMRLPEKEGEPPAIVSGGSVVTVCSRGPVSVSAAWELAYGDRVLRRGPMPFDEAGEGEFRLRAPRVRHRAACTLRIVAAKDVARRTLVIYPAAGLKEAAEALRRGRVGVLDPTGGVLRALAAEGVAAEDLAPQIARDFFDGRLVILAGHGPGAAGEAGHGDLAALTEACRRLDSRVAAGTNVVVLNPPAGWAAWGLRRVELDPAAAGSLTIRDGFSPVVAAEDLGAGPWPAAIEAAPDAEAAVWCEVPAKVGVSTAPSPASTRRTLVVSRRVGQGRVIASMLPQTESPDKDVVGRALMDAMILSLVEPPARAGGQPKENDHEEIH